ncbi:MAG: sulfatase-like hydrolase/transferase [Phycisphaerae bacterium]|nr:sulfatase-like hydrolase/transferase [Phycisphaerae bacterium]
MSDSSVTAANIKPLHPVRRLYAWLAPREYSLIMFGALFCTLAVKLFHALRIEMLSEYLGWILPDIAVLLIIEVILALLCFYWPRKWAIRTTCIFAAVLCTWSVLNAGWLIRTGTQLLPTVFLPLFRDPINALSIVGVNLAKSPAAAVILIVPSAVALAFFFYVLAKPLLPNYNRKLFAGRITVSVLIVLVAALAPASLTGRSSSSMQIISEDMRYNSQLRAVTSILFPGSARLTKSDFADAKRKIPAFDELKITPSPKHRRANYNVVLVVLEGVQYKYTSLYDKQNNLTPYLASIAEQGVEFTNARSSLTHTTKVLFSLLTGRLPSVSQDIAETVPIEKPYASLATILKQNADYKTAFFQSAKGNFESRPGLVHNLGFDKFWARDDSNNPDAFLGYLACDEFVMLNPIVEWIKSDDKPFFLTLMLSVTHDPYEVSQWFDAPAKEPLDKYLQTISYTDKFLSELDAELAKLNLTDKTILCVISDHGEAFGEHGLLGHERIPFDESLRIPFCLRATSLIQPKTIVTQPVSSIDLAPTLLTLLGFDTQAADFDGIDALGQIPDDRKVYFSGWLSQSPSGFVKANRKFIYYPAGKLAAAEDKNMVSVYDLSDDPLELSPIELSEQQCTEITEEITAWRQDTIFPLNQKHAGKKTLFGSWLCRWNNRVASVKHRP